jgi:ABC-type multidrug transport system fused ATPase/permease subunit
MIPDPTILKEYGLAIFLVVFLIGVFVYLLRTIIKQWTNQSITFTTVIQNHLTHNTQAMNDTCRILTDMKAQLGNAEEAHRRARNEHEDILREIKLK